MRDVEAAAEDCGVSNAVITPQAWSALVCMMNMPEKLQEALNKKLETENSAAIYSDLVIPTPQMCDSISRDEEARKFRSEGMQMAQGANRRSRTPTPKSKDSAMLAGLEYDQVQPANLGCFSCAEFGHQRRECTTRVQSSAARRAS